MKNLLQRPQYLWLLSCLLLLCTMTLQAQSTQPARILGEPVDLRADFRNLYNTHFLADSLATFDPATAEGLLTWKRSNLFTRQAFNVNTLLPQDLTMLDFPGAAYEQDPSLPFSIDFISPSTIRLRMMTSPVVKADQPSLMLVGDPSSTSAWKYAKIPTGHRYTSPFGRLDIEVSPFRLALYDAKGQLLTDTWRWADNDSTQVKVLPFNFIKRGADNSRAINPVFSLSPGERLYGLGESFTGLNKRGQVVQLFVTDPQGPETDQMYKPIPFFFSSKGYGLFLHTSAPVTCDLGQSYVGANKLFMGDENLDLFLFLGEPKTILDAYTTLTGKASLPPLWSFGTWMSRITYFSQEEGYEVASKLKEHKIPADVIHFDTGWFEYDWQCDYQFSPSRFSNPGKMVKDLLKDGYHISLWQLPYFTPKNRYFNEIIDKGLHVKNGNGGMPYEDAVLDFSNPNSVAWYQEKLAGLLKMGVGAIKVDFGEAAPLEGLYASGKTGWYEHNLYPLRYNKAVADVTKVVNDESIIWARSAWAGSQRYPLHWGGDAANTDIGMEGTLKGGLSLGLSGFSFWSHDIGGFVKPCPEPLYRRWLPFGFLTSHSRAHGAPPKEPWLYNTDFIRAFRDAAELKYSLMPYVYAQAKHCTETGLPMLRALLIEYPDDPGAWLVEDAYLFGSDLYVAPLLTESTTRDVYLPGGKWIDYQTGLVYERGWHRIEAGRLPVILLVRDGTALPRVKPALSTDKIDWSTLTWTDYAIDAPTTKGLLFLPGQDTLQTVERKVTEKRKP